MHCGISVISLIVFLKCQLVALHGRNSRDLSGLDILKTKVLENVGLFVIVKDERSYTQNRMPRGILEKHNFIDYEITTAFMIILYL